MTDTPPDPLVRDTTWMRDDCRCPTVSPDGDGCYLSADYTTGLCAHCQGHATLAARPSGDEALRAIQRYSIEADDNGDDYMELDPTGRWCLFDEAETALAAPVSPSPDVEGLHGYTCGICSWGRDRVRTPDEYEAHMRAHPGSERESSS